MDLGLKGRLFIVCGASGGFGKSIAGQLTAEGAEVIAVARRKELLEELRESSGDKIEILAADVTEPSFVRVIEKHTGKRKLDGILINAGGPPALPFNETIMEDWDRAYRQVMRWKIELTAAIMPFFRKNKYGRFLFIESASVKQPLENMILSTSFRLAVTGFVKSVSQENAGTGITFNIIAPGYHHTTAIDRIVSKMSRDRQISAEKALQDIADRIPMNRLGSPDQLGSLALWLLSPLSEYVTGQVFTVDGGLVKSTL